MPFSGASISSMSLQYPWISRLGEIAKGLAQLYDYMGQRLIEANIKKDKAPIAEVVAMLEELRNLVRGSQIGTAGGTSQRPLGVCPMDEGNLAG